MRPMSCVMAVALLSAKGFTEAWRTFERRSPRPLCGYKAPGAGQVDRRIGRTDAAITNRRWGAKCDFGGEHGRGPRRPLPRWPAACIATWVAMATCCQVPL